MYKPFPDAKILYFWVNFNLNPKSVNLKLLNLDFFVSFIFFLATTGLSNAQEVFFNEIHYDNVGTDVNEFIEIAGPAGTSLSGWSVVLYNGSNGAPYSNRALSDVIANQANGFGFVVIDYPENGIQNGAPDGLALVNSANEVVQFISYEGDFVAVGGPADGLRSSNIGVEETSTTPGNFSLQLAGSGNQYIDFTWAGPSQATKGLINEQQSFTGSSQVVFINELHYDNAGADLNEGIEVAGNAGLDLAGWSLVAYNGSNGLTYNTITLTGTIPDQQNGYGTVFFTLEGLQNGAPDGIALVDADGVVVQFLSYEGVFTALNGPANTMESQNIGVAEDGNTPADHSLQLTGSGLAYADFVWAPAMMNTRNSINTGQSFGGGGVDPEPEPEPVVATIVEARALPLGTEVIINGTLTVSDQLGGPAFIQDKTGGMALFDFQVQQDGAYSIGDSLRVIGSIGAFNQQIQLIKLTSVESFGLANAPIAPKAISIADISAFEGQLVTIPQASFEETKGLLFPESNYKVSDGTGLLDIRIDGDVNSLVGRVKPQTAVDITGVVGSFRGTLQLFPRGLEDLPGTTAYLPEGMDIPVSTTFDVVTWNMEFFGATQKNFGPANVQLQLENAKKVLDSISADIIAVQEVSDKELLMQLVADLAGYAVICSDRYSYSFDGVDPNFPAQQLCYIYNTATVKILDERVIFEKLYDAARAGAPTPLIGYPTGDPTSFWSSGRLPYLISAEITIEGNTQLVQIINIHAKSGSSSTDIARKFFDVQALKDTLDQYYPDENIILLGDYNDDVDESIGGGTSSYESFIIADNFDIITSSLSEAGLRSFLFNDNVIDHITISNELYDEYLPGSEVLFIPFNLVDNYANTTSDHLPVLARFNLSAPLVVNAGTDATVYLGYDPLACNILQVAAVAGGTAPYTFSWSNGSSGESVEVCPEKSGVYTLTVTDALGRTSTDDIHVCVIDVGCGNNTRNPKVQLCHNPSGKSGKEKTLCVSINAVAQFLAKGATLGSCAASCNTENLAHEADNNTNSWDDVKLYPNPVENYVVLEFNKVMRGSIEVVIFNHMGYPVANQQVQIDGRQLEVTIAQMQLPKGFYYLKATNAAGTRLFRIFKQ